MRRWIIRVEERCARGMAWLRMGRNASRRNADAKCLPDSITERNQTAAILVHALILAPIVSSEGNPL
jgi:hypothetical protein